jgi:hypothetical protein
MNATAPCAPPVSTPFRRSLRLVLALAALVPAAVGCGQEGKTVQAVLPIDGLAYDASSVTVTSNATDTTTTVTFDVKVKLQTLYQNGCEARGGIELRAEGSTTAPTYVLTPLARYTADESCNIGIAGDTLQTITISNLSVTRKDYALSDTITIARFEARGFGQPAITFDIDLATASRADTTTLYSIRVEDETTGLPLDGAIVRVERYGTPDLLSEGSTVGGVYEFTIPCGGTAGTTADPYVVKVSYSGRIAVLRVAEHPALCKRKERVVVRV